MARILIADDNDAIRHLMRSYIEHAGHVVCVEAQDGVQAIECAKQTLPDLILLDFNMPDMNGIETTAVLKRVLPEIPIIVFTLHEELLNKELAAIMGADLVVEKTKGIPKLAESVKTLLAKRVKTSQSDVPSSDNSTESSSSKNADDVPRKPN
jgi:CheY-like chemotaxis protein